MESQRQGIQQFFNDTGKLKKNEQLSTDDFMNNKVLEYALDLSNYSFFENGEIKIEVDRYNKLIKMTGLTEYSNNTYQNLVEIWKKLL